MFFSSYITTILFIYLALFITVKNKNCGRIVSLEELLVIKLFLGKKWFYRKIFYRIIVRRRIDFRKISCLSKNLLQKNIKIMARIQMLKFKIVK